MRIAGPISGRLAPSARRAPAVERTSAPSSTPRTRDSPSASAARMRARCEMDLSPGTRSEPLTRMGQSYAIRGFGKRNGERKLPVRRTVPPRRSLPPRSTLGLVGAAPRAACARHRRRAFRLRRGLVALDRAREGPAVARHGARRRADAALADRLLLLGHCASSEGCASLVDGTRAGRRAHVLRGGATHVLVEHRLHESVRFADVGVVSLLAHLADLGQPLVAELLPGLAEGLEGVLGLPRRDDVADESEEVALPCGVGEIARHAERLAKRLLPRALLGANLLRVLVEQALVLPHR